MTILELAMALLVCMIGLNLWLEHKQRMKKLEIEHEEMRQNNERIRAIIKAVGVQGNHDQWFDACDKIMKAIDE